MKAALSASLFAFFLCVTQTRKNHLVENHSGGGVARATGSNGGNDADHLPVTVFIIDVALIQVWMADSLFSTLHRSWQPTLKNLLCVRPNHNC